MFFGTLAYKVTQSIIRITPHGPRHIERISFCSFLSYFRITPEEDYTLFTDELHNLQSESGD